MQAVIDNLNHPIIKVRVNSTKTLKTLSEKTKESFELKNILVYLEQNLLKNNYQLQTQTILLAKNL